MELEGDEKVRRGKRTFDLLQLGMIPGARSPEGLPTALSTNDIGSIPCSS